MMKRLLITICSFAFLATWAKGHYDSIRGRISSDWKIENNTFLWKVTVPANTTATLGSKGEITEGGRVVPRSKFKQKYGRMVLRIGSGSYNFAVQKTLTKGIE